MTYKQIFERQQEIRKQLSALNAEDKKLRAKIAQLVNVRPGDVLERRDGSRVKVISVEGDFDFVDDRIYPSVTCQVAPATKSGYHTKHRLRHTVISKEWFEG